MTCTDPFIAGIYPDLLHIVDLQMCSDVISSCLLELSDAAHSPRDVQLQEHRKSYEQWCHQQGSMAASARYGIVKFCKQRLGSVWFLC